jgi:rare lipoprotein A
MYPIAKHTNRLLRIPILAGTIATVALAFSTKNADNSLIHAATANAAVSMTPTLPAKPKTHWYQFGRASWYGHALQGMQTASGEAYDMNGMTCAHRSLPMGALVRVTNLRNHKSIVVRVNDRGPVPETRVVDLSYAAAHLLGFNQRGTAPVRIDVVSMKPSAAEVAQLTYPELSRH